MEEEQTSREITKDHLPKIRDNLGIETSRGLLDIDVDRIYVFNMLLKGVSEERRKDGWEMAGKLALFFGKRPLEEVFGEKVGESARERGLPEPLATSISSLGRGITEIQKNLSNISNWKDTGAYFHDEVAPFLWLNLPELVKDTSLGEFRDTWRHEVGHFYHVANGKGEDYFKSNLVYLGTFCGLEFFVASGGLLVSRVAEKVVGQNEKQGDKTRSRVSRKRFLQGSAIVGSLLLLGAPFSHRTAEEIIHKRAAMEKEAPEEGQILTDGEIMRAFNFNFRS